VSHRVHHMHHMYIHSVGFRPRSRLILEQSYRMVGTLAVEKAETNSAFILLGLQPTVPYRGTLFIRNVWFG